MMYVRLFLSVLRADRKHLKIIKTVYDIILMDVLFETECPL